MLVRCLRHGRLGHAGSWNRAHALCEVCCGSDSVIRRCRLDVRFARKRTRLGDFMTACPRPPSPPRRQRSPAVRLYMIVGIGSVRRHADDRAAVPRRHGGTAESPGLDQAAIAPLIAHCRLKEISTIAGWALRLRGAHCCDGRCAQRCQRQACT
jgi:hypothetical protein